MSTKNYITCPDSIKHKEDFENKENFFLMLNFKRIKKNITSKKIYFNINNLKYFSYCQILTENIIYEISLSERELKNKKNQ